MTFTVVQRSVARAAVYAGIAAAALSMAPVAEAATLCPNQATPGGFGNTVTNVSGPLDGACGINSAVKIDIAQSTSYGKLQFQSSTPGFPPGLTLGALVSASANVVFSGVNEPYFLLAFVDSSNSLGQGAATNQILMLGFQPTTLSGNTLPLDPNATQFNLYDNTAGVYLQGGQQDTHTLNEWLSLFPVLAATQLDGIWIGLGLTATDSGPESLTVNSLEITSSEVPLPASLPLFASALGGVGGVSAWRRRRRKAVAA